MMTRTMRSRRTQAERSDETRHKLLQATIEVLVAQGYHGLTTAQVDAKAGMSSGARVHHYRSKADLVIAATSYAYDCAAVLGRQRAAAAARAPEPLREFIADLRTIYFDWPFLAATEVLVTARTAPELMASLKPILERFHAGMKAVWLEAFVAAGYEPERAEPLLALTLNLIRGMAINRIWQHDQASYERLVEDWCRRETIARALAAEGDTSPRTPARQ